MKNALVTWQMTWQSPVLATAHRSVMPTDASASVRVRAFDAVTAVAARFTGIAASAAAAKPCTHVVDCAAATAVAAHRGPDAWRPSIC